MKNKTKVITGIFISAIILIVSLSVFYFVGTSATSKKSKEVIVTIDQGSSINQAINTLDENGLIKNKLVAKVYCKLHPLNNLQANTYILDQTMDLKQIFSILENPPFDKILSSKLTVIEGQRLTDIAASVAKALNISKKEVLEKWGDPTYVQTLVDEYDFLTNEILEENIKHPLEGYLYPETYFITGKENTIDTVTHMLLDMTKQKITPLESQISDMGYSVHEFLTLSSIVEAESLFDEDKPMIAGVFINRLNDGMKLQSDVTVNYALDKTGVNVSYNQLQTNSFYNTYKYAGLPVGPICNVSQHTMESTLNYKKSDYYYFFANKDGKVLYSKTLKEHEDTIKKNRWY